MSDLISRQAAIKAYSASDRKGDAGYSIVVFAETAGKAKAYATQDESDSAMLKGPKKCLY